ncbi:hypothetical protein B566_EDAN007903 [Ephemera danica]|nr:hypothetical protein B566_EDAN007903 [Ephemera danica]
MKDGPISDTPCTSPPSRWVPRPPVVPLSSVNCATSELPVSVNPHRNDGIYVQPQHPRPCKRKPCTNQLRIRFENRLALANPPNKPQQQQGMEDPQSPPHNSKTPLTMAPTGSGRPASKVSQIANIFTQPPVEVVTTATPTVTTNMAPTGAAARSESHASSFEIRNPCIQKLGEQDGRPVVPCKADKLVVNTQLLRNIPRSTNGHAVDPPPIQPPTPPAKIIPPAKPPKPERKFSSKELIEKQRNWTAHFKNRTASPRGEKPQPPPTRPVIPPPITPLPPLAGIVTPEKQEREVPEKRDWTPLTPATPPSPVSPPAVAPPISPTPSDSTFDCLYDDLSLERMLQSDHSIQPHHDFHLQG